ncbi:MAG TPA: hypothetical protein PKW11_11680, partial [Pseudomonadota bacterium]|nr:hypothetical protein [Pseudomonadota bacterium]
QTPAIGQSQPHLQPYGRPTPASIPPGMSQPGSDQTAPHMSSSGVQSEQKKSRRNLFIIAFVLALLAPIGALVYRWVASSNKDADNPQPVVEKPKPKPAPEPPKEKPKFKLKVTATKPVNLKRDGSSIGTKAVFEEEIEKSDSKIHFTVATPGCKPAEFDYVASENKEIAIKCGKKK